MRIKEGFKIRPLGHEFIVTAEGVKQVNFNKMVSLNASAAYLFENVHGKEYSVDDLKGLLLERYDVAEELAADDAAKLAKAWIEAGIAEE